jgi:hypothetical protein
LTWSGSSSREIPGEWSLYTFFCQLGRPFLVLSVKFAGYYSGAEPIALPVVLGVAMLAEALFFLWIGWSQFVLATNNNALYTFSFLMLLYFAVFSVVSARERRVLVNDVQQGLHGRPHRGSAHGHNPDALGSAGTHAIALGTDPRDFRLCHGLVSGRERRREGRDDQAVRAHCHRLAHAPAISHRSPAVLAGMLLLLFTLLSLV